MISWARETRLNVAEANASNISLRMDHLIKVASIASNEYTLSNPDPIGISNEIHTVGIINKNCLLHNPAGHDRYMPYMAAVLLCNGDMIHTEDSPLHKSLKPAHDLDFRSATNAYLIGFRLRGSKTIEMLPQMCRMTSKDSSFRFSRDASREFRVSSRCTSSGRTWTPSRLSCLSVSTSCISIAGPIKI